MSIVSSLYSAASGLSTIGQGIQVISNNIANVNTVGFKGARSTFEDLLSQTLIGGSSQIGRGVNLASVDNLFSQGSFQNTPLVTDMGINGEGFFVLRRGVQQFYSRAGQFRIDNQGYLVNPDNLKVQGFKYDPSGNPTGELTDINLSFTTSQPRITGTGGTPGTPPTFDGSGILLSANFDADAEIMNFDASNPGATSNFSSTVTIYDSLGNGHQLTIFFNKTAPDAGPPPVNHYSYYISCSDPDLLTMTNNTGTLDFDENGALDLDSALHQVTLSFTGADPNQVVGINFSGSTYYAAESAVKYQSQDGFSAGNLTSINVDEEGRILGIFSNGTSRTLAQVALARFENVNGLLRAGSNLFSETGVSGAPLVTKPTLSGTGTIIASALELSNVDLAQEFINLITSQRAFQANSRVIVTSDEIMEQLVNLT
jgi:flagellar hook protein FlgE